MANISLFIGGIRPLPESGRPTGMYKQPVNGPLELGPEGFVGDQQADRRVHGGPDKAVHLYPAAHYARLAERFDVAAIGVACALGYLDFRFADIEWRPAYPGLARIHEKLMQRPAFSDTLPHD